MVKNKVSNLIDTNVNRFLGGQTGKGGEEKGENKGVEVTDLLKGGIKGSKAVKDLIIGGTKLLQN